SEASFCVWTKRSCVVRRSSSDFASSRVRVSTFSYSRAFWIATTDWSAKVCNSSIVGLWKCAQRLAADNECADDVIRSEQRNYEDTSIALAQDNVVDRRSRFVARIRDLDWLALRCCRRNIVPIAKADMLIADRRDHGFAHAVGGM